jgi:hypothetical protein
MKRKLTNTVKWGLVAGSGLGLALGCGSKKDSKGDSAAAATETSVTVAGTLALSGSSVALALTDPTVAELDLYCVTFQIPPVAKKGDISATGEFSLTLENAAGTSVGCFILKGEDVVGSMVFKDSDKKSMDGTASTAEKLALNGGVNQLGTVTLNLATGLAEVDVKKIVNSSTTKAVATANVNVSNAFDFTGDYTISNDGVTLPAGYTPLCTLEQAMAKDGGDKDDCEGPIAGMNLYLQRLKGKSTVDGSDVFGLQIWAYRESFEACGSKLGFTYEEGKTLTQADMTSSGIAEGPFGWTAGLVDGWKDPAAYAMNTMMDMEMVDNFKGTGISGSKNYFSQYRTCANTNGMCDHQNPTIVTKDGYNFYGNTDDSGCKKDGKPIQYMGNWDGMTHTNEAIGTSGLNKSVSKKTDTDGKEIVCTNIMGMFAVADDTPITNGWVNPGDSKVFAHGPYCDLNSNGKYDSGEEAWRNGPDSYYCNNSSEVKNFNAKGQLCSTIDTTTDKGKVAQLRCYAEYMSQNGKGDNPMSPEMKTTCSRKLMYNWAAKTEAEFLGTGPAQPNSMFIMEKFSYDSPNSGSFRNEERRFDGIQVGNNWTDCEVMTSLSFTIRKEEGSSDLYAEMIENTTNLSPKPACVANYGAGKISKSIFKMKKK